MRSIIASIVLGYMNGACFYQYDPQIGDFILYNLIPFGIGLDKSYVAYQALNNTVAVAPILSPAQTAYEMVHADLLPTLGSEFVSQFDKTQLLSFYFQPIEFNIELFLEQNLINASLSSPGTLVILLFSPSNRKQEFFSSIKLKNRVEILVYTENVRSNFLNFYLKMVNNLPFLNLRHLFKLRPTHNSSAGFKVTVNI
jgi:hypothetical protein